MEAQVERNKNVPPIQSWFEILNPHYKTLIVIISGQTIVDNKKVNIVLMCHLYVIA